MTIFQAYAAEVWCVHAWTVRTRLKTLNQVSAHQSKNAVEELITCMSDYVFVTVEKIDNVLVTRALHNQELPAAVEGALPA